MEEHESNVWKTYPFLVHVDDESPTMERSDAEELHLLRSIDLLWCLRRERLGVLWVGDQSFDVVRKEILNRLLNSAACEDINHGTVPYQPGQGRGRSPPTLHTGTPFVREVHASLTASHVGSQSKHPQHTRWRQVRGHQGWLRRSVSRVVHRAGNDTH